MRHPLPEAGQEVENHHEAEAAQEDERDDHKVDQRVRHEAHEAVGVEREARVVKGADGVKKAVENPVGRLPRRVQKRT